MDEKQWHAVAKNSKYAWKDVGGGNVRSGVIRLSFCDALFEPKRFKDDPGSKPRFGTTCLLPPGDDAQVLVDALKAVIVEHFGGNGVRIGEPAGDKVKVEYVQNGKRATATCEWPLHDQGDKSHDGYKPGSLFFSAYAGEKQKPRIVDARLQPITDPSKVYAGGYAIVTVRPYWPKGWSDPAIGLQLVQFVADGERFGGSSLNPEDAFEDVSDEFAGESIDALL